MIFRSQLSSDLISFYFISVNLAGLCANLPAQGKFQFFMADGIPKESAGFKFASCQWRRLDIEGRFPLLLRHYEMP